MKCVAKLNADGELNTPGSRILCDVDTDHVYQGSSLCVPHVIQAYERAESESGFGGLFKGLEKITIADIAKVSAMMRPLMEAFSSPLVGATPAVCTVTVGCLLLQGHEDGCSGPNVEAR